MTFFKAGAAALVVAAIAAAAPRAFVQTPVPWAPGVQSVSEASPALSPAESMKTFRLAPGYRVELVAAEPLIQDPIAIDWDADGRLWAIEMPGYMPDIRASTHRPVGSISVVRVSPRESVDPSTSAMR